MRGIALIQVGETLNARLGLTRTILLDTLWRQAALIVAATLLVWFSVRLVLRPLMRLKNDVATRQPTDLSDFDPSLVHKEVRPLVLAMNGYMARLQILIDEQRRFIADASHQLRTPLTVLKTQAELALRENDPHALRQIVRSIGHTTESAVHLANRLLTLARAEHGVLEGQMIAVSLAAIAREVGLELAPAAVRKNIDLSLDAQQDVVVTGNALLLHEMVVNLVDNAIRYTPPGGRVSLRVFGTGQPTLEVEDSGSGIPQAERSHVFAPFYRATAALEANPGGSGLGLAIVQDITKLHGARLELADGAGGQGLNIIVRFSPRANLG
jgi:two-component system sensor histidine kinase TctE